MQAFTFWKAVTMDHANFLEALFATLEQAGVAYCVIGGQAVNAYVEPLVSLDLDLAVAVESIEVIEVLLRRLKLSHPDSKVRLHVPTDPRYSEFVSRASIREVLGIELPVASIEDVLRGLAWAFLDTTRRVIQRRKDLLDIERLLESYPELRSSLPDQCGGWIHSISFEPDRSIPKASTPSPN